MPPGLTIPSIFTAVDRFSAPMRMMRGALGSFVTRAEVGLARVERGFRRVMSPIAGLQNMLRGLGVYFGLFSAIMLMRSGIGIMADFEQAQINIASVVDKDSIPHLKLLSNEARKVAVQYGQSAAAISNFQFELVKMGYNAKDVIKMTEPITTGAVALRTSPERLQEVIGAILKSHDMPVMDANGGNNAQKVVNQLTYVANATAAQFEDLATMLPIINRLTHKMNISFPQALAVLGQLRNVQIHTSTGATSFKNILLDLKADSWDDLRKGMEKVLKARNATLYSYNKFGKKSVISALEISSMFKTIEGLAEQTKNVSPDYTNLLAAKQLDSIRGRIGLFSASYKELVLSIDDGRGKIGGAIKQYLDIGSAMLLISADSDAAKSRLAQMDSTVIQLANKYLGWLKVIGYVVAALIAMKIAIIAFNAIVLVAKVVMFAWNTVLGVSVALGWANVAALRGNVVAIGVLRGMIAVATAAQWLWNAALAANPIGLVVIAIASLGAAIGTMVIHWNEWGAASSFLLGALAPVLQTVMAIAMHWSQIVSAFSKGSILDGIKAIGKAIMDSVLYPLQQLYTLLSNIPGLGSMAKAAKVIQGYRAAMWQGGAQTTWQEPTPSRSVLTPKWMNYNEEDHNEDNMRRIGVQVDINNKSGFPAKVRSEGASINMRPQSTFDDFNN